MGDVDGVPNFQLWYDLALAVGVIWKVNEQVQDSLTLFVSLTFR